MQPTVGQFEAKPVPSSLHATIDSPVYGIPLHALSARHEATSLWSPHLSPGGLGHQSDGLIPHGPLLVGPGEGGVSFFPQAVAMTTSGMATAIRARCTARAYLYFSHVEPVDMLPFFGGRHVRPFPHGAFESQKSPSSPGACSHVEPSRFFGFSWQVRPSAHAFGLVGLQ
jgi:hypothetical protein